MLRADTQDKRWIRSLDCVQVQVKRPGLTKTSRTSEIRKITQ